MFTFFKKHPPEEAKWENGYLPEEDALIKENLPMLKHAYEAVLLNYKDLQQSYLLQQARVIETCKWLSGFYIAFFVALKQPYVLSEATWYHLIPIIGTPVIISMLFSKYLAQTQYPIGNQPSGILTKELIKKNEGLYYYYLTVPYEERIIVLRNTLKDMSKHYKQSLVILSFLLFLYATILCYTNAFLHHFFESALGYFLEQLERWV